MTNKNQQQAIDPQVEAILLRAGFVSAEHVQRTIDIECNGEHKNIQARRDNVVANAEADCKNGVIKKSNAVTKGDDHILNTIPFTNQGVQKLPVGPSTREPDATHHLHLNHNMW